MKRRRVILAVAGLGLILLAGAGVVALRTRSSINKKNFDRLAFKMSRADATGILGGPPRDERTNGHGLFSDREVLECRADGWDVWVNDEIFVLVLFDSDDLLVAKDCLDYEREPLLQRLMEWCGISW